MTVTRNPARRRRGWCASAVAVGLALAGTVLPASSALAGPGGPTPLDVPGNILVNPSFEQGTGAGNGSTLTGWQMLSGGNVVSGGNGNIYRMSNNPYSGTYGFGTGNGTTHGISQTVTVPYS